MAWGTSFLSRLCWSPRGGGREQEVGPVPSSWAGGLGSGRAPRGVGVSEGAAWLVAVGTHLRAFVRS